MRRRIEGTLPVFGEAAFPFFGEGTLPFFLGIRGVPRSLEKGERPLAEKGSVP
jgi:hypothetical protein